MHAQLAVPYLIASQRDTMTSLDKTLIKSEKKSFKTLRLILTVVDILMYSPFSLLFKASSTFLIYF